MKPVFTLILALALGAPAIAQDQDKDKETLKRDLLKEVEKRLKSEEDRLLKDLEKVVDEELHRAGKAPAPPPKAAPKADAPPPVAPPPPAAPRKVRGYLGVRLAELSDDDKKDLNVKSGLKVAEVVEGGPAEKAGLRAEDVLLSIDGREIDSTQEIAPIMRAAGPGTSMKIEYLRDGKKKSAVLVLAPHPADLQPAPAPPKEQGKGDEDLRERVRKFLEKKEAPQDGKPRAKGKPAPDDGSPGDLFAFDEDTFEQFRDMFEKLGVDPEQFFEKGKDGKYHLNDQMKELFKNFNLDKFKDFVPKFGDEPGETPAPAPRRVEPRKTEPKSEAPRAPRPWLGLQPDDVPDELRAQLDLPEGEGLLVAEVLPGSPAEKAGLRKNDILTKIDGKGVKGEDALARFMASAKAGQETTLTVLRKSKEQQIKVTIGLKKD